MEKDGRGNVVMLRIPDERDISITATDDSMKKFRDTIAKQWGDINEGWKKLEQRMIDAGVTPVKPDSGDGTIARLNVGGLYVDIPYFITSQQEIVGSSSLILSALLLGTWDERVPRDGSGRIFVDGSHELYIHFLEVAVHSYKSLATSATPSPLPGHATPFSRSGDSLLSPGRVDDAEVKC